MEPCCAVSTLSLQSLSGNVFLWMIYRIGIVGRFGALSVCVRSGRALLLTDRALSSPGKAKHRRTNTRPVFLYVCMFACPFICLSVRMLFFCVLVLIDGQGGHSLSSQGKQNTGEPILGPFCLLRLTCPESQECLWDRIDGAKLPFTGYDGGYRQKNFWHNHSTCFVTN